MKITKITLSYLLCAMTCASCVDMNVFNMLVSFVTIDDRPTVVLLFHLCWTPYDIKSLVKSLSDVNINVAHFIQRNRNEYFLHHVTFVADLSCKGIETHLVHAGDQGYFQAPYRWLLLQGQNQDSIQRLAAFVDSDVVIARQIGDVEYLFIEAYKICEISEVIYHTRAMWRPRTNSKKYIAYVSTNVDNDNQIDNFIEQEIINDEQDTNYVVIEANDNIIGKYGIVEDYRESKVLSSRRTDLKGYPLTIANVITDSNDTMHHLDDRLQLHLDSATKMSYAASKICFEMLNSTLKNAFTNSWGYKDKDGNWTGVVEFMIKKKADLGTISLFTKERMEMYDYIAMIGTTAIRFVFREPPLTYQTNIFVLPFTRAVWLAVLICTLACAVFLYITSKWEASMSMTSQQLDGSWADVLIFIIGAVLQQGCTLEPRFTAGRCVTLLLFVALTILFAAYSAYIVVLLRAPSSSIKNLQDLLDSSLQFGASDFEYNRYFFKKLNDPIRKAIYDKKIAPKGQKPNYLSMEEGVERIRRGLFVFHMETNPGYRLIQETYLEDEKCDLVEIDYVNLIDPWLPGQKRSPFKELFKINFLKIRETGLQSCNEARLQVSRPRCSGTVSKFSSVGFIDMYPVMLATLYGMMMAPAVLVLEIFYKRLMTMREARKLRMEHRQSI